VAEVTLPTKEEIAQLPRWARVAFAARCARRALPLFSKYWPYARKDRVETATRAVEVTERSASVAIAFPVDYTPLSPDAYSTATAAAAHSAAFTVPFHAIDAHHTANAVTHTARAGVARSRIRQDFELLLVKCRRLGWTDDTPVPPSVFPPIEDDIDLPEVVETAEPLRSPQFKLILDSFAADGTDPQEVKSRLIALFNEMDEYSFLRWGKGLTIDDFTQYMLAGVPEVVS
jgi:hypothetical protein